MIRLERVKATGFIVGKDFEFSILNPTRLVLVDDGLNFSPNTIIVTTIRDIIDFIYGNYCGNTISFDKTEKEITFDFLYKGNKLRYYFNYEGSFLFVIQVFLNGKNVYNVDNYNHKVYQGSAFNDYIQKFKPFLSNDVSGVLTWEVLVWDRLCRKLFNSIYFPKLDQRCVYDISSRQIKDKSWKIYQTLIKKLDLGIDRVNLCRKYNTTLSEVYDIDYFSNGHQFYLNSLGSGVKRLDSVLPFLIDSVVGDRICMFDYDAFMNLHPCIISAFVKLYKKFNMRGQVIMPWYHNSIDEISESDLYKTHSEYPRNLIVEYKQK